MPRARFYRAVSFRPPSRVEVVRSSTLLSLSPPDSIFYIIIAHVGYACTRFCLTFAAFRLAKTHCRVTSIGASFTATGTCGREGRVAKHPWVYAPGPKPLNARMRKPYLVLGQRPRTQNCVEFGVRRGHGPGRETFDSRDKGPGR